ncbi:MAG: hypothetical protein KGL39_44915 [Patescibacteria group bacterium]|nr:hypothetical protein [Patescibacteria group bacterium]
MHKTIEELADEYAKAERAASKARNSLYQAVKAAHPFQPGDIISASNGDVAKVIGLKMHEWKPNTAECIAVLRKIDGTFGTRRAPMRRTEWDNPTLVSKASS